MLHIDKVSLVGAFPTNPDLWIVIYIGTADNTYNTCLIFRKHLFLLMDLPKQHPLNHRKRKKIIPPSPKHCNIFSTCCNSHKFLIYRRIFVQNNANRKISNEMNYDSLSLYHELVISNYKVTHSYHLICIIKRWLLFLLLVISGVLFIINCICRTFKRLKIWFVSTYSV